LIIRARAPLRISFCGGGTDVPPYPEERGGVVLSTTIDRYAYCTLIPREDDEITVKSLDYDLVASYHCQEDLKYDGELDLVKAVIKKLGTQKGLDLFMHSDAPPGSGLGSSSTLVVALIGAFARWLRIPLTDYEIASLAYEVEREELAIKGGKQDQYAATFGGFNFIEFLGSRTIVNPLRIPDETLNELEYHLLLCYTGATRLSANIIDTQVSGYVERKRDVVGALDEMKAMTIEMKNLLLTGRLDDFGRLLHTAWESKKHLAPQITTSSIDALYAAARKHGTLGGKILGAGGGGYLLLYCQFDRKHIIAEDLEKIGGKIVPFRFEQQGMETWQVNGN
jgi:D-glycero-alpha-D-manno-heptose-7-phosphate kinase